MILNAFKEEMNQEIVISSQKKTFNPATGQTTKGLTTQVTILAAYYTGSSAERLVSERFKTVIDGVLIIDPASLIYAIQNSDEILVNGYNYSVVFADDIMYQGEAITIGVKRK